MKLSSEQRITVMTETGPKGANLFYNSVDVPVRKEFLDSLGRQSEVRKFTTKIRDVAVSDFWDNERVLISEGKGMISHTEGLLLL